jgi:hypothetical protein
MDQFPWKLDQCGASGPDLLEVSCNYPKKDQAIQSICSAILSSTPFIAAAVAAAAIALLSPPLFYTST